MEERLKQMQVRSRANNVNTSTTPAGALGIGIENQAPPFVPAAADATKPGPIRFEDIDMNGDGVITREEYERAMAGNAEPVEQGRYRRAQEVLVAPPLNLTAAAKGPAATADEMRKMLEQARRSLEAAVGQNKPGARPGSSGLTKAGFSA